MTVLDTATLRELVTGWTELELLELLEPAELLEFELPELPGEFEHADSANTKTIAKPEMKFIFKPPGNLIYHYFKVNKYIFQY
jgi:hypothetical protein